MSERDMLADLCGGRRGVRHMPQVRGTALVAGHEVTGQPWLSAACRDVPPIGCPSQSAALVLNRSATTVAADKTSPIHNNIKKCSLGEGACVKRINTGVAV